MKKLKTFNRSYLGRLRNQEFPETYAFICRKFEGSVITEEYLTECLELANAKQGKLGLLKNLRTKHLLTTTISELSKDRQDYFLWLNASVKNAFRSPYAENRKAAKLLDIWLDRYREFIYKPKMDYQHNLVNQLKDDMTSIEEIGAAMDVLDLTGVFGSIEEITAEIQATADERSSDREAQSRMARELRRSATETIESLMSALKLAITLKSENSATYVGIWNEICRKLDELNAATLSRITRKRNEAEKNEQAMEPEVDGEENVPEGYITTTSAPKSTTAMRSRPYNVLRLNERMDEDLQIVEKAYEDWAATNGAMKESETHENDDVTTTDGGNTVQTDDADAETKVKDDAATGNSGLADDAEGTTPTDGESWKHDGATKSD